MAAHSFTYTYEFKRLQSRIVNNTEVIDNVLVDITGTDTVDSSKIGTVEQWIPFNAFARMAGDISDFIPIKQVTDTNIINWVSNIYDSGTTAREGLDALMTLTIFGDDELQA
jgi:hypothetical protein